MRNLYIYNACIHIYSINTLLTLDAWDLIVKVHCWLLTPGLWSYKYIVDSWRLGFGHISTLLTWRLGFDRISTLLTLDAWAWFRGRIRSWTWFAGPGCISWSVFCRSITQDYASLKTRWWQARTAATRRTSWWTCPYWGHRSEVANFWRPCASTGKVSVRIHARVHSPISRC